MLLLKLLYKIINERETKFVCEETIYLIDISLPINFRFVVDKYRYY